MRVIVVSEQPALALALGAQLPGCDARSAASIDAVIDLTSDEAAVVLDVGSEEARERWMGDLRQQGLHRRTVVIGDAPGEDPGGSGLRDAQDAAADDGVLRLHRPFSFADLATALAQAASAGEPLGEEQPGSDAHPDTHEEAPAPREESEEAVDPASEAPLSADDIAEAPPEPGGAPDAAPPPAEPRVAPVAAPQPAEPRSEPPAPSEGHEEADVAHGEPEATAVDAAPGEPEVTAVDPAPAADDVLPASDGGPVAREDETPASAHGDRPPLFDRLFRTRREAPPSGDVGPAGASDAVQEQVLRAAGAVHALEGAFEQVPALADPSACARAVVAEIGEAFPEGAARVLLRAEDQLDDVAATGLHRELTRGALALDHPFLGAVRRGDGALLLVPTDEARGLLAGVPLSSWPALFAVEVTHEGATEALVLMGAPETASPQQLRQLTAVVEGAGVLLRFAAALRRLQAAGQRSAPEFLRSWMTGADQPARHH